MSTAEEVGVIDIPVGLTSSYELDKAIRSSNTDTIIIRNANMSPIEGYATDLAIDAAKIIFSDEKNIMKRIYASLSDEGACFKVPRSFLWLCCVINTSDLAVPDESVEDTLYDMVQRRINDDEDKYKGCQLWIRVISKLSEKIEKSPDKEILKQMVLKTIVEPYLTTYEVGDDI